MQHLRSVYEQEIGNAFNRGMTSTVTKYGSNKWVIS